MNKILVLALLVVAFIVLFFAFVLVSPIFNSISYKYTKQYGQPQNLTQLNNELNNSLLSLLDRAYLELKDEKSDLLADKQNDSLSIRKIYCKMNRWSLQNGFCLFFLVGHFWKVSFRESAII